MKTFLITITLLLLLPTLALGQNVGPVITVTNDRTNSGTITVDEGTVSITGLQGPTTWTAVVTGTFSADLRAEVSGDGSTWVGVAGITPSGAVEPFQFSSPVTLRFPAGSFSAVRIRAETYSSGTVSVALRAGAGGGLSQVLGSLNVYGELSNNNSPPAGTNIGVLPAVANASVPSFTEGRQGLLSMDLSGRLRSLATLAEYTPVSGRLPVDPSGVTSPISAASLPLPTGASTLSEQQTQTTALQLIDDAVHANDVALGKVAAIGAQFDDTSPGTTTENNIRALRMSTRRELYTQLRDAAGNERGANVTAGNALVVDGSAATQPVSQSGTWTVQPGNTANSTPWLVSLVPPTSGGTSTCYITSAASTNSTNCKASAGQLYNVRVINTTSTIYYLRLYNSSSAPTCSSATGFIESIPVPHGTGSGAGVVNSMTIGQTFGTGIGFCLTGGGSSTDNTNAATGVYISLLYK